MGDCLGSRADSSAGARCFRFLKRYNATSNAITPITPTPTPTLIPTLALVVRSLLDGEIGTLAIVSEEVSRVLEVISDVAVEVEVGVGVAFGQTRVGTFVFFFPSFLSVFLQWGPFFFFFGC